VKRTTNVEKKNEKKKENKFIKFLKKHRKKILLLVLLCIFAYITYMVVQLIKNPTDTVYVEMGQIREEELAIGYIIRDETVLKGDNYKNGLEQIKTEGEKVAKGESVFRYYSNNEENLVKKIQELDEKIDEAMAKEDSLVDTKVLEEQIDVKINELYGESNLKVIQNNKDEILTNMSKKSKIAGEQSPAGSYLKKLIDERKEYENELNSGAKALEATKSGIVSYRIDGYEDVFTADDFGKYTKDFLDDLKLKTGQIIPMSSEAGKIVDNYNCYIVCVLDSEYSDSAEVGDEVTIKLPSGKETNATIEYKTVDGKENILTLKIDEGVEELTSYRKISFSIVWWSKTGLRIPNSAIKTEEKNGNQISFVTRTRIGYEDKIIVKILKTNEKYSIVTNYTSDELTDLGYTIEEIRQMPNVAIYDEILLN
jgi:hypothetical protein